MLAQLLPCENERSVEQHFMHSLKQVPMVDGGAMSIHFDRLTLVRSLKQAMFLRSGSTKAIMGLPEAQQNQIWSSVITSTPPIY